MKKPPTDIRGAARSIDPDNFGLLDWNEDVKKSLRSKFPPAKGPVLDRKVDDSKFKTTKISDGMIYNIIKKSRSKSGGISHISYDCVRRLSQSKNYGRALINAITELANAMSNQKIPFLSHFLATRTIPISKKDGTPRPVGVGDVIRRIGLKSIDLYHRQMVLLNCNLQYGNGFTSGCESIVHSIKNLSENMSSTNHVILALDASNAFNVVDRNKI